MHSKLRVYVLPVEMLALILQSGSKTVDMLAGLPEGALLLRHSFQYEPGRWALIVEHDSFDEVPDGHQYPMFELSVSVSSCFPSR